MNSMLFSKILWAIDVLDEAENHSLALHLLGALTRPTGAQVEPVFILGPPYAHVETEPPPQFALAYHALAEKRLAEIKRNSDVKGLKAGRILVNHGGSIAKGVRTLLDYAESENADAIVVATHGRKGVQRLLLGSFAETLLLHSNVPIFTVNPDTKVRERIAKILLPTTFQERYRAGFEQVVHLARALEASITLYYKEPITPSAPMSQEVYMYLELESVHRRETAKQWQDWANHYGVPTAIHLDNQPGYVGPSITEFGAKENFDLISLVSQADSLTATLAGSTARSVVRNAGCPVWITRAAIG